MDAPQPRLLAIYRRSFVATLGALTAVVLLWGAYRVREVALMLAVAGLLAYLLARPIDWLSARWGHRRLFTVAVFALFVLLLLGLLSSFVPVVTKLGSDLISNSPKYVEQIEQNWAAFNTSHGFEAPDMHLSDYLGKLRNQLQAGGPELLGKLWGYSRTVLSGTAAALSWMLLVPLMALYLLLDSERLRRAVLLLFTERHQPSADSALAAVNRTLGGYIYSRIIISLLVWVSYTTLLLLMDVPYSLLLGILAFFGEFVPLVGSIISFTVIALIVLVTVPEKLLWIVLIIIVIQTVQSYIVAPKIMSEAMDIHPLTVLVAMLMGGIIGGPIGLLLAVPTAAGLKAIYTVLVARREELLGVNLSVVDLVRRQAGADAGAAEP